MSVLGLQTAAPQGAVRVTIASYSENGGALQSGLPLPEPYNQTTARSGRRRTLLQSGAGMPYADANMQILCQGCNNSDAVVAALNGSAPSAIFSASGRRLTL